MDRLAREGGGLLLASIVVLSLLSSGATGVTTAGQEDIADSVMAAEAVAQNSPAADLYLSEVVAGPDEELTVSLYMENATNIAGYQARFTFDPSVVQVESIEGVDFSDPIATIDNEEGFVFMTAAAADGQDNPLFANITLSVVGEAGTATDLSFDEEDTKVNNETATVPTDLHDGHVEVVGAEVTDFTVSDKTLKPGQSTTVTATVVNPGSSTASVEVTLTTDGTQAETSEVSVPADSTTQVEFTTSFETVGTHTVSINDLAPVEIQVADAQLTLEDVEGQPESTVTVLLYANFSDVAGYQANFSFDPEVVQIQDISGVDFDDPTANINNEAGWAFLTAAQATPDVNPVLAEITFEVIAGQGNATDLAFHAEDTLLNDGEGNSVPVLLDDGNVTVPACSPGDANGDGAVTSADPTVTMRYIVGLPIEGPFLPSCADVDNNGQITSGDVTLIQQIIVGIDN